MPRRSLLTAAACAILLLSSVPSRAQQSDGPAGYDAVPEPLHAPLRSGMTREQFVSTEMARFRAIARGQVELDAESAAAARAAVIARVRALQLTTLLADDLDWDGTITQDETEAVARLSGRAAGPSRRSQKVMAYDANGDGKVDLEELRASVAELPAESQDNSGADTARFLSLIGPSGKLTAVEAIRLLERAFDAVDIDGDTIISPEEARAFVEAVGHPSPRRSRSGSVSRPAAAPPQRGPDDEIFLVGVYEGVSGGGERPHGPSVLVAVDRPGKNVTLITCSFRAARWSITLSPGTTLAEIKSFGASTSEFFVNDSASKPVPSFGDASCPYEAKGPAFRDIVKLLPSLTGFPRLSGFAGSYSAKSSGYVIDQVSQDPDFSPNRLQPAAIDGLPPIRFAATLPGGPGIYDLSGKLIERGLRSDGVRRVDVPGRGETYRVGNDGLEVSVSGPSGPGTRIPLSFDVPELSWPTGLAYDSRRNRIVLLSLGGEGFLYEYSIDSKRWRVIKSMKNVDANGLIYDEKTDLFWTTAGGQILALDPDGKTARTVGLDLRSLPGFTDASEGGRSKMTLAAVSDDHAVLMVKGRDRSFRIYLVDLATRAATLTAFGD